MSIGFHECPFNNFFFLLQIFYNYKNLKKKLDSMKYPIGYRKVSNFLVDNATRKRYS